MKEKNPNRFQRCHRLRRLFKLFILFYRASKILFFAFESKLLHIHICFICVLFFLRSTRQ
jgi:hypothetical protein